MDIPKCLPECKAREYGDADDWFCKNCHNECDNCTSGSPYTCLTCYQPTILLGPAPNVCTACPIICPDSCHLGNDFETN